jgi:hypothetical protein
MSKTTRKPVPKPKESHPFGGETPDNAPLVEPPEEHAEPDQDGTTGSEGGGPKIGVGGSPENAEKRKNGS